MDKALFHVSVRLPKPTPRSRFRACYSWSVLALSLAEAMEIAQKASPEMGRDGCDWRAWEATTGIIYHGCSNPR